MFGDRFDAPLGGRIGSGLDRSVGPITVGSFLLGTAVVAVAVSAVPLGNAVTRPLGPGPTTLAAAIAVFAVLVLPFYLFGTFVRTVRAVTSPEPTLGGYRVDRTDLVEGFYALAVLTLYAVWVLFLGVILVDQFYYERPLSPGQWAFVGAAALCLAVAWYWNLARLTAHAVGTRGMDVSVKGLMHELGYGALVDVGSPNEVRTLVFTIKPALYDDIYEGLLSDVCVSWRFARAGAGAMGVGCLWIGLVVALFTWPPMGGPIGGVVSALVVAPVTAAVPLAQAVLLGRAWTDLVPDDDTTG